MVNTKNAANTKNEAADHQSISDPIQAALGQFGRYHALMVFVICMLNFPVAWHQFSIIFTSAHVYTICEDEEHNPCNKACKVRIYDTSVLNRTIRTDWDLECSRSELPNISQLVYIFGILLGSFVFGTFADWYGRRMPLVVAVCIQIGSCLLTSTTEFFWFYCVLRFFTGFATAGTMIISYVIMMELIGKDYREFVSVAFHLPFNLGQMSLPVFAYLIHDWRWLQFSLSLPTVLFISYFWCVPESPRWLFTQNRLDESIAVISKAARFNRMPTDQINAHIMAFKAESPPPSKKGIIIGLMRTRHLRCRTLSLWYNWFACGFTFYGLTEYTRYLGDDMYNTVFLSGVMGVPGTLVSFILIRYLGRRWTLLVANLITSIACVVIVVLKKTDNSDIIVINAYTPPMMICVLIAMIGMNIAFPTVYLYSIEVYPTVVRGVGLGSSSMICRIGAIAAPFMANWEDDMSIIPPLVFGIIPILGAILVVFLPETNGLDLPQTLDEGEQLGVKPTLVKPTLVKPTLEKPTLVKPK